MWAVAGVLVCGHTHAAGCWMLDAGNECKLAAGGACMCTMSVPCVYRVCTVLVPYVYHECTVSLPYW